MKDLFARRFTGITFVLSAVLLWLGWWLLPVRIGTFFEPEVFALIHDQFQLWIWMYRLHLFGLIMAVVALASLAAQVPLIPERGLVWSGVVVAVAGLLVTALGSAFYYHHGAWGSLELAGQPDEAAAEFVAHLRVDTEYVTCLIRFGRVFGGLGFMLLAWGIIRTGMLPVWSGWAAGLIGLASMALTMGLPDNLSYFVPVFHALSLWLLLVGIVTVRGGLRINA